MSDATPPQPPVGNEHLATVLHRIQHLIQESESSAPQDGQTTATHDDDIPVLTEVYEGAPEQLHRVGLEDMPALQDVITQAMETHAPIPEALADYVLVQMQPLIMKTVKLAVLDESVKLEKKLTETLQLEVLRAIRERLVSNQSTAG